MVAHSGAKTGASVLEGSQPLLPIPPHWDWSPDIEKVHPKSSVCQQQLQIKKLGADVVAVGIS